MWHTGSRGSHTSTQGHGRGWRGRGGYRDSVATPSGNATRGRYSAAWSQEKSVERDGSHRSLASYPQRRYDVVPPHNERGTWVTEPEGYLDWMAARTAPSSGTLGERPARCGAPLANGGVDVWTPEPEHDWSHAPGCQPEAGPVGSSRGAHGPLMKTPYPAPHPEAPPRTPWRAATYRQPEGYGTGRGSASVYRPPTRGGLVGPEPIAPSLHGGTVAPPAPALSVPPWPEPPPTYSRGGSHVARHQEPPSFDDFSRQMMSGFSPLHGPPHPAHPPPPFVPHHHHYRGHGFTPQHPQHHRSRHRGNAYDVPPPQPSQASGRSTSSPNFPDPVEIAMEAEPAAHRHVESAVPAPYESLTGETQALRPAIGDTAVIISTPLWGSLKEPGSVIPCGLIGGDEVSPRPEAHRVIGVPVTDWPTAPQSADPSPLPQHDTAVTASVFEVGQPASSEAPPTITTVASPEHVHSHSPTVPHATEPPHGAGDAAACPHRLGRNSSRGSGTPRSRTAAAESPLSLAATTKGATEGDISVLLGSVGRFFAPTPLAFVCAAPHIRQNWEVAEWTRARLATIEAHFPEVVDPTTAVMVQDVKQDGKSFRPGVMMPILGRRAHGSHSALLLDDAWKRGKLVSPGIAQRVHSVELPLILDDGEGMVHVFMKERLPRPTLPWLARPRREPRADPLKTHPQHCHTELSNPSPSALAAHVFEQQLPGLVEDMNALPVLHGFYCAALTFTFPRGAWEQVMRKLRSQGALRVFRVSRRELVETEDLDAPYMEDDDDDEEEEPEGGANTHTIRTAQQATPPRPGSPATTGISAADQVTSTSLPLAHGEREGTGAPRTGGPTHPSLTHTPVEVAPTVAGRSIGGGDGGEITNRAVAVSPTSGVASLGATVALESSLTQAGASRSLSRSLRGLGSSQHGAWPQTSIVPHFSLDGFEDFPHLQVVGIESCDVRTLAPLAACQDLREIYIQSCANLTAEGVRDGVKSLRKLEVLWLEATAVRELSFLATCTMLRELHMAMDPLFVTSSLRGVEQLPCLLNLRLDHVFVDDVSFLERSRSLRSLVITHCRIISAKALHGIENMPNLELLSLEYANDVRSVSFLEQAKSLKHLLLTRCHGLGTVGLRGVEHIPTLETLIVEHTRVDSVGFLASAPALTELRLKGCKRILRMSIIGLEKSRSLRTLSLKDTNVINVTALTGSTTIVELNLDSCRHLQQEGAEPLATMTSLEVLRMSATPISCVRFLSANGRLRELILDDCPNLTAHGLMGLTSLPMLEVLSLCSSQEVHEVGFLGECPSLRILRINGLERLRTPGLVGIERAARLEELYMEWCGVNSIVCLSHGCPCLRIIHASGCQRIANDGLHGLEKLPCLTHLMLDDLDLIDHIEFLKDAPALRKLSLRRCPGINAHGGECLRSIAPTVQIVCPQPTFMELLHDIDEGKAAANQLLVQLKAPFSAAEQYASMCSMALGRLCHLNPAAHGPGQQAESSSVAPSRSCAGGVSKEVLMRLKEAILYLMSNYVAAVLVALADTTASAATRQQLLCQIRLCVRWCEAHTTLSRMDEREDHRRGRVCSWWITPEVLSDVAGQVHSSPSQNEGSEPSRLMVREHDQDVNLFAMTAFLRDVSQTTLYLTRIEVPRTFLAKLHYHKAKIAFLRAKWMLYLGVFSKVMDFNATNGSGHSDTLRSGVGSSRGSPSFVSSALRRALRRVFHLAVMAQSALRIASDQFGGDCGAMRAEVRHFLLTIGCRIHRDEWRQWRQLLVATYGTSKADGDGEPEVTQAACCLDRAGHEQDYLWRQVELSALPSCVVHGVGLVNSSTEVIQEGSVLLQERPLPPFLTVESLGGGVEDVAPTPKTAPDESAIQVRCQALRELQQSLFGTPLDLENGSGNSSFFIEWPALQRYLQALTLPPCHFTSQDTAKNPAEDDSGDEMSRTAPLEAAPTAAAGKLFAFVAEGTDSVLAGRRSGNATAVGESPEGHDSGTESTASSADRCPHTFHCYLASRLNHSCCPNAFLSITAAPGSNRVLASVVAIRGIAPGEEITVAYRPSLVLEPEAERMAALGFTCDCARCGSICAALLEGALCPTCRRLVYTRGNAWGCSEPRTAASRCVARGRFGESRSVSTTYDHEPHCPQWGQSHAQLAADSVQQAEVAVRCVYADLVALENNASGGAAEGGCGAAGEEASEVDAADEADRYLAALRKLVDIDRALAEPGNLPRTHFLRLRLRVEAAMLFVATMLLPSAVPADALAAAEVSKSRERLPDVRAAAQRLNRERYVLMLSDIHQLLIELIDDLSASLAASLQHMGSSWPQAGSAGMRGGGCFSPLAHSMTVRSEISLLPPHWPLLTRLRVYLALTSAIGHLCATPLGGKENCSTTVGCADHCDGNDAHGSVASAMFNCCGAARHEAQVLDRPFVRSSLTRDQIVCAFQHHYVLEAHHCAALRSDPVMEPALAPAATSTSTLASFLRAYAAELAVCGVVTEEDMEFLSLITEAAEAVPDSASAPPTSRPPPVLGL